jgi:glutamyl-tRNA synthetase
MQSGEHSSVRVRFAPSPTGFPHVGNIRTALFNWLFARHCGGSFILRIEDTDAARRVEGAVEAIMDSMTWLGIDWDEGPFFQSERLNLYASEARRLVESGDAFYCFCTPERLEAVRTAQTRQHLPPRYDGHCRDLSRDEVKRRLDEGEPAVVRFRMPQSGETTFSDVIRGDVTFSNANLNDYVLLKSDGYPTYHLANVVDDHDMRISHVMRADEWISSTPLHVLLYRALGWEPALFAHLPMILGPDKSKLSKRHGATMVTEYRDKGYLPEAMVNFLALLGWSLDDKTDLLSRDELIASFSLERIGKTGAVFNMPKLEWMNGVYIRGLSHEAFAERALPYLETGLKSEVARPLDKDYVASVGALVQERVKLLSELPELCEFFFDEALEYPASMLLVKGMEQERARTALQQTLDIAENAPDWNAATLEQLIRPIGERLDLSNKQLFGAIRVAISGRAATPPLFETMEVLGSSRCCARLQYAVTLLR